MLELIEGETLERAMARRLAVPEALRVARQIAHALAAAVYLKVHATALLLERVDEARPLVEKIPAEAWLDPWLLEPCRRHGLR